MLAQALSLAVSKGMITSLKVKEEKPEEEDEDKKPVVDPVAEDEVKKAEYKPEAVVEEEKVAVEDKPEAQPEDKPEAVVEEEEEEEEIEEVKLIQVKKEYMYLIPSEAKKLDLKTLVAKELAKQRGKMYLD